MHINNIILMHINSRPLLRSKEQNNDEFSLILQKSIQLTPQNLNAHFKHLEIFIYKQNYYFFILNHYFSILILIIFTNSLIVKGNS